MRGAKELATRAGVEIQKGDPYSYHRNWRRVRRSNGETSYEEAAVLTAKRKDAITKVILLDRQVEKVRHNPRPVFITHFSHRHALHRYKMLEADEDLVQCDTTLNAVKHSPSDLTAVMNLECSVAMLVLALARAFTTTALLACLISTWRALARLYTAHYEKLIKAAYALL
ncbi:hypothetical protein LOK49_LG02G01251 [Camellia lanceoleosa]|uniref:Uncharacterized protein n=1 Tax=Camellia lanceoleosa TaxID=1840588 RepID=A0ACC0INX7_9ERIC|nr:hypothetical protein LOK49_LG02G01251 [Camellia lanceoleosa]